MAPYIMAEKSQGMQDMYTRMIKETAEGSLQKIEDILAKPTTDAGTKKALVEQIDNAKAALASGDEERAITITE
jgi:hypothetical protein